MTAADNLAITARAGKAFTFLKNGSTEFFPGAGSTLHFANRDTDTFTARNLPAGLLQAGDEVTVEYGNTTVFKGEVDRIVDRHGRGTDRVQDVTVAGPWSKLNRLVFRQTWGAGNVAFSSSRVILGQTAAGLGQHMKAQLAEIAGYAATPCGISLASADNHAPEQYLPLDEARDITCADAIRRELRFFPKIVVRFDYSPATPALEIVDPEHADAASYAATIPKTDREYVYNAHPVKYVDVTVDAVEITVNGDSASFHQAYPAIPSGTSPLDILHVTVPLARGGGSTTNETFEIESEEIPSALNSVDWWKAKHPRLANVAASAISFASSPTRSPSNYGYIVKNTKDEIEAAGKHCEVSRFQCKVKISTADDVEDEVLLTMDFLTTDARSGTYTVQTGSTATAGETLPAGLAQALYEQRSQSLVSESMTVRLGDSFPKLGDKLTETVGSSSETLFLQSFDVDVADLTARLSFGQPEHLSAEDMKSLLNGFRQRGSASTAKLREREGADEEDEPPAPGGIPPIASSEWSPGTKQKSTHKGDAQSGNSIILDTGNTGTQVSIRDSANKLIALNAHALAANETVQVHSLKYTDANGQQQTVKVLMSDEATIPPGGSTPSGTEVTVITGISFGWNSQTNQLEATLTKKSVTGLSVSDVSAGTAEVGLWKQNFVVGSKYDETSHEFTNLAAGSVKTAAASIDMNGHEGNGVVFEATAHRQGVS